jgi:hypothetical protein
VNTIKSRNAPLKKTVNKNYKKQKSIKTCKNSSGLQEKKTEKVYKKSVQQEKPQPWKPVNIAEKLHIYHRLPFQITFFFSLFRMKA